MKGDQLRAYYQIRDLSAVYDVYLISLTDKKVKKSQLDALQPYCKEIEIFTLSKWRILLNLSLNLLLEKPFQVAYFYQFPIQRKITKLLEKIRPDHIFSQLVRTTEYVKNYHVCPKTLDYMDALSKGMERRYDLNRNLFGFLFKMESNRLKNYEREVFDYFEHQTIISDQDRRFIYHPDYHKMQIIPNGIHDDFFERKNSKPEKDVVFVGNLSYAPNVTASEFLFQQIHQELPELKIQISGANPPKKLKQLTEENFEVTGFIDDIRDAYSNAKIFVAPMFIGTGMQNKILEAMAQGLPCITTSLANNAIGAEPNQEILIAETKEDFLKEINRLLTDEKLYETIQMNATAFVKSNYKWKMVNEKLIQMMS